MKKNNNTLKITIPLLIITACFVIYQYGYLSIKTGIEAVKERESVKTRSLDQFIALIAEKPEIERQLALLKEKRKDTDLKLMDGKTSSLSAAALQDKVNGIITGRGGLVTSGRVGKSEDLDKFKVISVTIDAAIPDIRALSDVLYAIETQTPYIVVKELDVRVRDYRSPRELMVNFNVAALVRGK